MKNKKLLAIALLTIFGVSNNISAESVIYRIGKLATQPEHTHLSDLKKYYKALEDGKDDKYIHTRFKKLEQSLSVLEKKKGSDKKKIAGYKKEFEKIKYYLLLRKAKIDNISDALFYKLKNGIEEYLNDGITELELKKILKDVLDSHEWDKKLHRLRTGYYNELYSSKNYPNLKALRSHR